MDPGQVRGELLCCIVDMRKRELWLAIDIFGYKIWRGEDLARSIRDNTALALAKPRDLNICKSLNSFSAACGFL